MPEPSKPLTAKRSPSILVTDVRNTKASKRPSAPYAGLKNVTIDKLLSNVSEVPSAQRRPSAFRRVVSNPDQTLSSKQRHSARPVVARMTPSLPQRTSKVSQRHVLIPNDSSDASSASDEQTSSRATITDAEQLPREARADIFPRVTSYFVAEGFRLKSIADYLKKEHKARVRQYDEALFVDYLLPLLPGDGVTRRVQSSLGDERKMEQRIDISEQGDHHFEYFSGRDSGSTSNLMDGDEFDPSEPQTFSPLQKEFEGRKREKSEPHAERDGEKMAGPSSSKESESQKHDNSSNVSSTHTAAQTKDLVERYLSHAELFILNYGVIVLWNFTEAQEKAVIADLTLGRPTHVIRPYLDNIESEEFNFRYLLTGDSKPRVFNDMITLTTANHMLKLAMSHAIAQSTKLSYFEERMQSNMKAVKYVPKTLALTGKLGLKRSQVLQISGRLFKLRVDVNLSSNILDQPDFFWESEPSLQPLYAGFREYLEIDQRILILNERCCVFLEFTSVLADSIAEGNMVRITVIVILLIVLSIVVSLGEIGIRFWIVRKLHK